MSFEHIKWAWNADKGLKSSEQLVLLALADRANKSGACWPSIPTISDDTHLNRKTVIRCINVLEHRGLVAVAKTHGDSNRYQLQKPPADLQPVLDYVEGVSIVAQAVVPNLPGVVPKTAPEPINNQSTSKTTTQPLPAQVHREPLSVESPKVVVRNEDSKIDAPATTQEPIPGIAQDQQKAARKVLAQLTPEQTSLILNAFTLALSKHKVSSKIGYLVGLVKAMKDGTFTEAGAAGGAPAQSLDDRLRLERQRQHEAQERGKMSNEQHAAWLAETFGQKPTDSPAKSGGRIRLKSMLGW